MKKEYMISRIVILVLTFIMFNIFFINEDSSWFPISVVLSIIVFGFSFPSTIVSKKILKKGDSIKNNVFKLLYYILLPIVSLITGFLLGALVVNGLEHILPSYEDFASSLGQAIMLVFLGILIIIGSVIPYFQTIIVIIIRKIRK